MPDYYETTIDKFFFKVRKDYLYSPYDIWVRVEGETATVGVTDLLQRKLGDIAFVECPEVGTQLEQDDQMGTLESAKATVDLTCPVSGEVVQVNTDLETAPERVNDSPYEEGWLLKIHLSNWEEDQAGLLTPEAYFELLKKKAQEALQKIKGM